MLSPGHQLPELHRGTHTLPCNGCAAFRALSALLSLLFITQSTAWPHDYRLWYDNCPGAEWNIMCRGCCEYDQIRCKCPAQDTLVGYAVPCCRNAINECDPCIIHPGCSIFENCKRCNNGTWGAKDDFFIKGKYCTECRPGWTGGDCMKCGGVIRKPQGHLVLESYPTNARCEWTIQVDREFTVELRFMMLSLEFDHNCRYDYVEVRDGDSLGSRVIGRFCGNERPPPIRSSGSSLHILFVSDGYKNFDGFFAIFQESSACSSSPCLNDGTCILDSAQSYRCACLAGYTGRRCENVVTCRTPLVPAHGAVEGGDLHFGGRFTFHCDPGFALQGVRTTTCRLDGTWSAPPPHCVPKERTCGIPEKPAHGDHFLVYGPGDVLIAVQYLCYRPYTLSGNSQRTCLLNSTWSGTAPSCVKVQDTDTGQDKDKGQDKDTGKGINTVETKDKERSKDAIGGKDTGKSTDTVGSKDLGKGINTVETKEKERVKDIAGSKDTDILGGKDTVKSTYTVGSNDTVKVTDAVEDNDTRKSTDTVGSTDTGKSPDTVGSTDTGKNPDTVGSKDIGKSQDMTVSKDAGRTMETLGGKDTGSRLETEDTGRRMETAEGTDTGGESDTGRDKGRGQEAETDNQSISEVEKSRCPALPKLYNGFHRLVLGTDEHPYTVEFFCNNSYALSGNAVRTCQPNGSWSGSQPMCIRACREPKVSELVRQRVLPPQIPSRKTPVHKLYSFTTPAKLSGLASPTKGPLALPQLPPGFHHLYTHIEYECASLFYHHSGSARRTCLKTGKWSGRHVSCSPVCGKLPTFDPQRLAETRWPWHAAIYRRPNTGTGATLDKMEILAGGKGKTTAEAQAEAEGEQEGEVAWQLVCSGALVNQRSVVVAAHCVTELGKLLPVGSTDLKVVMGKHYRSDLRETKDLQHLRVSAVVVHPNYDPLLLDSDLAVLKLLDKARIGERVLPVCLPSTQGGEVTTQQGYVVGWSILPQPKDIEGREEEMARAGLIELGDTVQCERQYAQKGVPISITDNMLCGRQHPYGISNICPADTGGVVVVPPAAAPSSVPSSASSSFLAAPEGREEGVRVWRLLGVVSHGYEQRGCSPDLYTVYTRAANFKDWIEANMK
ncbi:hypothetical protein MATL_G00099930 [Megalops atlanticus]|uniref:Inactive serine protease PAMR1 n=1 Tax=Megalops atlanticus TaxID=7932 RepID=A0A9D3Q482_MEGAT|nr:hypothetical protein MATL_G00099930 [Megalops atlanticus]